MTPNRNPTPAPHPDAQRATVRPFRRIAVTEAEWRGKGHWDLEAMAFRRATLTKARAWAKRLSGTVVIGLYRRRDVVYATIQGF